MQQKVPTAVRIVQLCHTFAVAGTRSRANTAIVRRRLAIALISLAGLTVCFLFLLWPSEPRYQGRPLGAWLAALDDGEGDRGMRWVVTPPTKSTPEQLEAAEAIRHMGSNALPQLIKMLRARESFLRTAKDGTQAWLTSHGLMQPSYQYDSHTPASAIRHRAALGLVALEATAKPRVSELLPLFNDVQFCKESALVLASMGAEGFAPLESVINLHAFSWQSTCALWALAHFPETGRPVIPVLVAGVTNHDLGIRHSCAWALTRIQSDDAEFVVRALTNALGEEDLRILSLKALANYGPRAHSAVPILVDAIHSLTPSQAREVVVTLRAIDPAAADSAQRN